MHRITQIEFREGKGEPCCLEVGDLYMGQVVTSIEEFPAKGEGDRWRWEIHLDDGNIYTVFDVVSTYKKVVE